MDTCAHRVNVCTTHTYETWGHTVTTLPPPPPEAELIKTRREEQFLSVRQAALSAGISPSAWSEVETARKKVAPGIEIYRRGTTRIVAMIARFLRITPGELRDRGRPDVADYLIRIGDTLADPRLSGRQRNRLTERMQRDDSDE